MGRGSRLQGLSKEDIRLLRWHLSPTLWCQEQLDWRLYDFQADAINQYGRNQMWLWGRQTGKSTTDACLALHQAVLYAGSLVLILSASLRQSAELFRKVVEMFHRLKDAPRRMDESSSIMTLSNGSRIVCLPGSGGTIRGYSAPELIILDEAAQCPDALYHAILPMLLISRGKLVLSSSAYAKIGFFWEIYRDRRKLPEWYVQEITVDQCPFVDKQKLEEDLRAMGRQVFDREYNNVFMALAGGLFTEEDIASLRANASSAYDITAWNLPRLGESDADVRRREMLVGRTEA
jgi:hypothetical protein